MSNAKASLSVNVDATNPGQFFACCGLLELAHRLWPGAEGWFYNDEFLISTPAGEASAIAIVRALSSSQCEALGGSADPKIPPIRFGEPFRLRVDWWIDESGVKTAFGKMFAGQKRTLRDVERLQREIGRLVDSRTAGAASDLFGSRWAAPLPGRFGVDPRAAWEALDVGFSPNDQAMDVDTYVLVELVGAIGLQVASPRPENDSFQYATWSMPLPASVSRAAASGVMLCTRPQLYRFRLTKRGSYKGFDFATPLGG